MNKSFSLTSCIALFMLLMGLSACKGGDGAPLPVVPQVDVQRYAGTWYEIAKLPNRFQKQCVANTRATYTPEGQDIVVLNSCTTESGKADAIKGIAKVVDGSNNAKLRVSFFRPFYGDYWILKLDQDYQWVLIGTPSREYAWILSRKPQLDESTLENLLDYAQSQGFNRAQFERSPQKQ